MPSFNFPRDLEVGNNFKICTRQTEGIEKSCVKRREIKPSIFKLIANHNFKNVFPKSDLLNPYILHFVSLQCIFVDSIAICCIVFRHLNEVLFSRN